MSLLLLVLGSTAHYDGQKEMALDTGFRIPINQKVKVKGEGLEIFFASGIEDSRCPEGADRIWSGNAKIALEAGRAGREPAKFEFNTHLNPKSHNYSGYAIKLVELSPYPKLNEKIQEKNYEAVVIISKR